jgi:uncharacterized protein (TIGR02246 family)
MAVAEKVSDAVTASPGQDAGSDQALVRAVIAEQVAAMRAGDADRLVARFAPDAVTFDLAPPLRHAGAEVRDAEGLRGWFATFAGPVDYEVRDLDVTVGGDVAFCHSLNRLSATPRGVDTRFDLWFRATVCLRKRDGVWRVTHEHTSTPFHMAGSVDADGVFGFRAATDLTP